MILKPRNVIAGFLFIVTPVAFAVISPYLNKKPKIMKQITIVLVLIMICTSASTSPLICHPLLIKTQRVSLILTTSNDVKQRTVKKKISNKQKIFVQWIRKKSEDQKIKKSIKTLGLLSFIGSLTGIGLFMIAAFYGLFALALIGLSISLLAFIVGLIALIKRSKLKDKTGTRAWPALLGMIFGIGFLIAITIWILIELFGN
jgi:hypothetical protein